MRIYLQRAIQEVLRIGIFAQAVVNHSGMKQEQGIVGVQSKSFVDRLGRFLIAAILAENPGQRVPSVDVVPDFKFSSRKFQGLRQFDSLICVEQSQLPISQYSV